MKLNQHAPFWDFRFLRQLLWRLLFWNVAPCSLIETHRRFGGAYCLFHEGDELLTHQYGGSKHLWNIDQFLLNYMVQHSRRQSSSTHYLFVPLNWSSLTKFKHFLTHIYKKSYKLLNIFHDNQGYVLWRNAPGHNSSSFSGCTASQNSIPEPFFLALI
jgi:hypothetical protein